LSGPRRYAPVSLDFTKGVRCIQNGSMQKGCDRRAAKPATSPQACCEMANDQKARPMETLIALVAVVSFFSIPFSCLGALSGSKALLARRQSSVPGWILVVWIALVLAALIYVPLVWFPSVYSEHARSNSPPVNHSLGFVTVIVIVVLLNVWIQWATRPR
jgi:hypothetical protein